MNDKDTRQTFNPACTLGIQTGPQTIVVRQVVGEQEQQKVLDIHIVVPDPKPAIEQIIDVLIKNVEVNSIDVICNKVIVRGDFEIKAIYVACKPDQAVHAVEIKNYKWTQDISIPGAVRGMDADATVAIEFVDFEICEHHHHHDDCDHHHDHHHNYNKRAYKYNSNYTNSDDDENGTNCDPSDSTDTCTSAGEMECTREFDVSVVMQIIAKVMTDREIQINPVGTIPIKPAG